MIKEIFLRIGGVNIKNLKKALREQPSSTLNEQKRFYFPSPVKGSAVEFGR